MMPHERAAAQFQLLPWMSGQEQLELALLLLDELELEPHETQRVLEACEVGDQLIAAYRATRDGDDT
jgi:hypothetical protein